MYVAITRARQRLYLSFSQTRLLHGQTRYNVKSRFVDELPEAALRWLTPRNQGFGSGYAREYQNAWQRGTGLGLVVGAGRVAGRPAYAAPPAPPAPAMLPALASKVAPSHGLRLGQSVFHNKFGEGVVLTLEGSGSDARAQLNFGRHGAKWLALAIAPPMQYGPVQYIHGVSPSALLADPRAQSLDIESTRMASHFIVSRRFLRAVARGLVGVLLSAQMAIAGYVCPMLSGSPALVPAAGATGVAAADAGDTLPSSASKPGGDPASTSAVTAAVTVAVTVAMPCADMDGMADNAFPNLCAEHCKYGQQTDNTATLSVPVVLLTALYAVPQQAVATPMLGAAAARLNAPPAAPVAHAVLHCVYRI